MTYPDIRNVVPHEGQMVLLERLVVELCAGKRAGYRRGA